MGCVNYCFKNRKLELPVDTIGVWNPNLGTSQQKLTYESYLFNFNSKQIEIVSSGTTVEFSNFALHNMQRAYNYVKQHYKKSYGNYYVVCPVYCDPKSGKLLDTQFSVTGTCYKGENEILAAKRELSEEIGVKIVKQSDIKLISEHIGQKRVETTYFTDISNARAFDAKLDIFSDGKDDKSKKIQIIVVGDLANLKRIYSTVYERPPSDDLQTIRHVRFISLKEFF